MPLQDASSLPADTHAHPAPGQVPECRMAGAIGTELTPALQTMEHIVQQLLSTGKLSRQQVSHLLLSIETAQYTARHALLLDRLTHTPVRQSHEEVPLAVVMQHTLKEKSNWLQGRAVEVIRRLENVTVIQDATLLDSLLEAALFWMARPGYRLLLSLELMSTSQHARITFKSRPLVSGGSTRTEDASDAYHLSWRLLETCAEQSGVIVRHVDRPELLQLTLEFPRTVQRLQVLTQLDIELGGGPATDISSRASAGKHLLLVTGDRELSREVLRITQEMEITLNQASNTSEALACCEKDPPDLILLDQSLDETELSRLKLHLQGSGTSWPCIDIIEEDHTLTMSLWSDRAASQVSRKNISTQLLPTLVREFSKLG